MLCVLWNCLISVLLPVSLGVALLAHSSPHIYFIIVHVCMSGFPLSMSVYHMNS